MLDNDGKISHRALTAAQYKKLKGELQKKHTALGKKWLAAKKEAEADGVEFVDPKPIRPRYKALGKMSSRANALKLAAKYQRQYEARKRAKEKAETL